MKTDLKAVRKNDRNRQRKSRKKTEPNNDNQEGRSPSGYSAQSLGKAVNRAARHLPKSPRKLISKVIRKLATQYYVCMDDHGNASNKGECNKLDDDAQKAVIDFYCRDDISWQSPNRKDDVKERNSEGQTSTSRSVS